MAWRNRHCNDDPAEARARAERARTAEIQSHLRNFESFKIECRRDWEDVRLRIHELAAGNGTLAQLLETARIWRKGQELLEKVSAKTDQFYAISRSMVLKASQQRYASDALQIQHLRELRNGISRAQAWKQHITVVTQTICSNQGISDLRTYRNFFDAGFNDDWHSRTLTKTERLRRGVLCFQEALQTVSTEWQSSSVTRQSIRPEIERTWINECKHLNSIGSRVWLLRKEITQVFGRIRLQEDFDENHNRVHQRYNAEMPELVNRFNDRLPGHMNFHEHHFGQHWDAILQEGYSWRTELASHVTDDHGQNLDEIIRDKQRQHAEGSKLYREHQLADFDRQLLARASTLFQWYHTLLQKVSQLSEGVREQVEELEYVDPAGEFRVPFYSATRVLK